MAHQTHLSPRARSLIGAVDNFVINFSRHWLLYTNLLLFIFIALPFLAPALLEAGYEMPARVVYTLYSLTCHQLAYRTWFLFGAQPSYTVGQLQQYLGVNHPTTDLLFWRDFVGNSTVGYKMAYCERDAAIYSSAFIAAIVYSLFRQRIKPLGWKWYLIFAIAPMALDGLTQLLMLRESDPLLRTVTGTLFGVLSVWLIFPYVNEAMQDMHAQSSLQLKRLTERALSSGGE